MWSTSLDASQSFDIPQLKIFLFSSVPHFLIELFDSLESNFLSSLYILDTSPLSDVRLVKIFPSLVFVSCPFDTVLCFIEASQYHEVPFVYFLN